LRASATLLHPAGWWPARGCVIVAWLRAELPNWAAALAVGELPPTEFSLSCTAAELARDRLHIERSLGLLARGGHRVHLEAISLPNFSAAELERLGVDLDATEAVAALGNLFELETRWSGTLSHRALGCFDTVLFTPWTTVPDVVINLRIVRGLGLTAEFGSLLGSRLRLVPGSALHRQAVADGLAEAREDAEVPWRLRDATLEDTAAALRELGAQIGGDPFERALALLDVAATKQPDRDAQEHVRVIGDAQLCERCEQASDVAVRRRLKPIRRPTLSETELPAQVAELSRRFGPQLAIASTPHHPDEPSIDLVYGVDAAEVREFVELSRRSQLPDSAEARDAINRRIGALLGYPPCCVEAFIDTSSSEEDVTERTLFARRLGAGVLDPRWPLLLLVYEHYLACSLHCERSLARADELEAALAEAGVDAPLGGWGRIVFLADLERQGNVAVLLRESDDAHGFRYRLIALNHRADVLAPLQLGDRLEFGPQTTTVMRGEQPLHVYAAQVGLFDVAREWGDAAWFRAYFRAQIVIQMHAAMLAERERASERSQAAERDRVDAAAVIERTTDDAPLTAERIRLAIQRLCGPAMFVRECEAGRAGAAQIEWIRARLEGDAGNFVLTVVPRRLDASSERDSSGGHASGVAARFDPTGRLAAQHELVRSLAERLDVRATTPAPGTAAAKLLELVRQATQPETGEFQTFAGFAACWPICERSGSIRLALVAHGEVLELIIAERSGRDTWPGKSSHCAVGYPSDKQLRSDRARAAFARFVQRLRLVDP
jgi:hypothetical protein